MQYSVSFLILIISLYLMRRYKEGFLFIIPIINILIDVITGVFPVGSFLAMSRALVLLIFIFYIWKKKVKIDHSNIFIFVFVLYLLFLIPFSSDIPYTVQIYLKVFTSMMMFPVAYYVLHDLNDLKKLHSSLLLVVVIITSNYFLAKIFHYGRTYYGSSDLMGYLTLASYNAASYWLILLPVIIPSIKKRNKKILIIILSGIVLIILILTMRRTVIISVFIGYFVYFLFTKNRLIFLISLIPLLLFVTISYPLYKGILQEKLTIRESRLKLNFYESEERYLETKIVFDKLFSEFSYITLFGKELFNSPGHYYEEYNLSTRQLHTDYNVILYGSGVIGLIIYLFIFIRFFSSYLKYKSKIPKNWVMNRLSAVYLAFIVVSLFISFGGQIDGITFRSINFMYLGAILKIFRNEVNKNELLSR